MLVFLLLLLVLFFVIFPIIGIALWALISTIVVGLIIGGLARLAVPGIQTIGLAKTVVAGLIGSILGGFFAQHVFGLGWFLTLVLEIAVAAVAVAGFSRSESNQLDSRV